MLRARGRYKSIETKIDGERQTDRQRRREADRQRYTNRDRDTDGRRTETDGDRQR